MVVLTEELADAINENRPIVALESTVISHGLPYPDNWELAKEMEAIVRAHGAVPGTIAVIEGQAKVGLSDDELAKLADGSADVIKISRRDFGAAIARKAYGATTVAATMIVAHKAGIDVFATGGIGGVHRGEGWDVSADLIELSQTPVAVVCAGAKSILDLPRTLEWLETFGVPVVGYGTNEFPSFYTPHSGLTLTERVNTPAEAAAIINAQWDLGLLGGILVTVPIPTDDALAQERIEDDIQQALNEAAQQNISGKETTPFLLQRLVEITGGDSLRANLALLKNNAAVAAQIAVALKPADVSNARRVDFDSTV
ncbi:MAG: pseudouridine-5'-phosphate glycosidase [Chloroflexi bacterium]|nr:pseudouridine-5'-phosphate glycosidase [Chloroflexota bacterium]